MIVAVVDTNVFVSAFLAGRTPLAVLETARSGKTLLLITTEIATEIERTLLRPKFAGYFERRRLDPLALVQSYTILARYVTPVAVVDCPIEDDQDLKFIECAVGGGAQYVVSGDHHLLALGQYRDVQIVRPAQYLSVLSYQTGMEE